MNAVRWLGRTALVLSAVALTGCGDSGVGKPKGSEDKHHAVTDKEAKEEDPVKANLAQLSAEDRQLAEAQKYCPITEERLGDPSMGLPFKVMVHDQPVLLCCKSCQKRALADPDKTLAKVNELKVNSAPPKK